MKLRKSLKSSRIITVHQALSLRIRLLSLYHLWWLGLTHQRNPHQGLSRLRQQSQDLDHRLARKNPRTKKNSSQTRIFNLDLLLLNINKSKLSKPWLWQPNAFPSIYECSCYARVFPMEMESQMTFSMSFTEVHGWVFIQISPLSLLLEPERTGSQQFTSMILFSASNTFTWTFLINLFKWSLNSTLWLLIRLRSRLKKTLWKQSPKEWVVV